jgi:hypothetical protein
MKKFIIIVTPVVILILCVFLLRQHVKISGDRNDGDFRQGLTGAWSCEFFNIRCTNVVAPDGSFTSQLMFSHPGHTNTYKMAGTWHIKDGCLIETVTNDSNVTAPVPRTRNGQIARASTSEFVVVWQGTTNEWVWQRVGP